MAQHAAQSQKIATATVRQADAVLSGALKRVKTPPHWNDSGQSSARRRLKFSNRTKPRPH